MHYKAIIIGSGQGGTPLAHAIAKQGDRVALIEKEAVGGTCVNTGCTPTKTMVASARIAHLARRGADYGVNTGPITVDLKKVRQRKRDIVTTFRSGSEKQLKDQSNIDLIYGQAHFTGPKTITVNGEEHTADWIVIDTGTRPRPIGFTAHDSTSIMELDHLPTHLVVIGGGYIGLEFAEMFHRFGSKVTVITRGDSVLSQEDDDVSSAVVEMLQDDGIELITNTTIENHCPVEGSCYLAAVGRIPNTDKLNLEAAGIQCNKRGFIPVNDRLETNVPGVFAIGDVNGGPAFTHISYDDFRILKANLLGGGSRSTANRQLPYTIFIDPQLGRIGMTERQARELGHDVKVFKMPMSHVARALELDETSGFLKAVIDNTTKRILGFAAFGIEGGELMAVVQVAMLADLPYTALQECIFAHPTLAEALNNLFN